MREPLFVKQIHKHACSIACVAMITGENYDALIKEFGNDFHKYSIDDETLLHFIGCKGFSLLEKEVTRFAKKRCRAQRDAETVRAGSYRQSQNERRRERESLGRDDEKRRLHLPNGMDGF